MVRIAHKLLLPALIWLVLNSTLARAGIIELKAKPDYIRIGAFYHGTGVLITGNIPPCDYAVIKIEGQEKEVILNRKGKMGVIWLNVAKVTVKNAPQVYILAASDKSVHEEREKLGLGYEALRGKITFESNKNLTGMEFDEFIRLKEDSGVYDVDTKIDLKPVHKGRQKLSAVLPIPATMPPGDYRAKLYCFRNHHLARESGVKISIEKVGLPQLLTTLAYKYSAVYGILAIAIAMVMGIAMGLIFSSRAGSGH